MEHLQLPASANLAQQKSWEIWKNFDFKRHESWRWTPQNSLSGDRELTVPNYALEVFSDNYFPNTIETSNISPATEIRQLDAEALPFYHLNKAFLDKLFYLKISDGKALLSSSSEAGKLQFLRSHFQIESSKDEATLLQFNFSASQNSMQIPVLHLQIAEGANTEIVIYLDGAENSSQILTVFLEQSANSQAKLNIVQSGAGTFKRVDLHANLQGENADFQFGGIQALHSKQVADIHVNIRHENLSSTSMQTIRGVLSDKSFALFDGMIYVAPKAQLTNAGQDSRYILQDEARSQSVPRLEIYADDVQCAHGSTTGKLDEEALFYMQSRGIPLVEAKKILMFSFLQEGIIVEDEALRSEIVAYLNKDNF